VIWPYGRRYGAYLWSVYSIVWGVGIQFISVNARLFTLLAPPLSPPDFRTRPVDRFAPPGHNKYIHLHGMARYNARKGPQLNGPRISDTIGSYLALPRRFDASMLIESALPLEFIAGLCGKEAGVLSASLALGPIYLFHWRTSRCYISLLCSRRNEYTGKDW